MNKEKITLNNLIYALLFLVLGIILLTTSQDLLGMASKIIGSLFIIVGIIKSIIYIYMKGKVGDYSLSELIIGLLIIGCGILLVLYSSTLSFAIKLIVGLWVLLAGINKIILAISMRNVDKIGFRMYLVSAIIMVVVGILLISGLVDKIIGLFIIIYSVAEIVDYIYYKSKSKDYEPVSETKNKKDKKKVKRLKKEKVVDAIIEEDTNK
ncbi:MAG: DUF308 domain-containing protein [Bacilli bacterium]|nr:DUF308 domain-containing protein [Bacilli bacterium]